MSVPVSGSRARRSAFPPNFVWGAATSAYQIEGAARVDGRGPSVWDMLCARPDRVWERQNGDVACDHYHRFREDVALMRETGLAAYRFSIAWPRVIPAGTGKVNDAGLAFYDRLVDALLEAGIQPWVTLFHWDYPYELYVRGGWLNPESPQWFADYARVVVDRLSDRVSHWMTHNEPQCFIGLGLHTGEHAPGDRLGLTEVLRAGHHALLAHGLATQVIRERAKRPAKIGWAHTGDIPFPATDSPEDLRAAREAWETIRPDSIWNHLWWNDPLFRGEYPAAGLEAYGAHAPKFSATEMRIIHQPLDFFGTNNYRAYPVRRGADGQVERVPLPVGVPLTHNDWTVQPELLRWSARHPYERYGKPVVITENGFAGLDWVNLDGRVPDGNRIDYLRRHLLGLRQACADGVAVEGFFAWSFLDNFEWNFGYRYRFGLVHVDYATQRRTLKDSARWYSEVIRSNGGRLDG
ncbi:MAG TPA: GH1 family beta-glucosidase [Candidatus Synoicihabitans sp.]|nr:GH1 family beta-glucosidase [Candidatus Synoicihabitans sp.]